MYNDCRKRKMWMVTEHERGAAISSGQRLMQSRQASLPPPSSAELSPNRSFIISNIISSILLPSRRAGHCSRGSLVVFVLAFVFAVLSMCVFTSSVDTGLFSAHRTT